MYNKMYQALDEVLDSFMLSCLHYLHFRNRSEEEYENQGIFINK